MASRKPEIFLVRGIETWLLESFSVHESLKVASTNVLICLFLRGGCGIDERFSKDKWDVSTIENAYLITNFRAWFT